MTEAERRNEWRLDRRFSFALILALVGQIATAAWFASKTDSRIEALEIRYFELAEQTARNRQFQVDQRVRVWERVNNQGDALNDLRTNVAGINARLDYISHALDRMLLFNEQRWRDERANE